MKNIRYSGPDVKSPDENFPAALAHLIEAEAA